MPGVQAGTKDLVRYFTNLVRLTGTVRNNYIEIKKWGIFSDNFGTFLLTITLVL